MWMRILPLTILVIFRLAPCVAQDSVSVSVASDTVVKAGEWLNLTVTLDKAPTFEGRIHVYAEGPVPEQWVVSDGQVLPKTKTIAIRLQIPPTASGGQWRIKAVTFWAGFQWQPLAMKEVTFRVIANEGLVFPGSAAVTVNPSQIQLLRRAALNLQSQIEALKANVSQSSSGRGSRTVDFIRREIKNAMRSLDSTESSFYQLAGSMPKSDAAQTFFADLRQSYEEALNSLNKNNAADGFQWLIQPVALGFPGQVSKPRTNYPILLQAALRPFEQNELAYTTVADSASLIFDLTVTSTPAVAAIGYRRRGDAYHQNPDPTNTVVKSLPYAIWLVQFQKSGYKTQEREHDPFREPNHVLNVELKP
jgi:hypothetical protein